VADQAVADDAGADDDALRRGRHRLACCVGHVRLPVAARVALSSRRL
jgi:hypothetical protein